MESLAPFHKSLNVFLQGATVSDNGGGLALMMESVRVLMLDPGYRQTFEKIFRNITVNCLYTLSRPIYLQTIFFFRPDYSVLFVAFDKRHDGSVGSKRFIDEYLFPHVLHKYKCKIQVKKSKTNFLDLSTLEAFSQKTTLNFESPIASSLLEGIDF